MDVCLIPEVDFDFDTLAEYVRTVMDRKGHAVVCVAEGAGQSMMRSNGGTDASGNPILQDIGTYLRDALKQAIEVRLIAWLRQACLAHSRSYLRLTVIALSHLNFLCAPLLLLSYYVPLSPTLVAAPAGLRLQIHRYFPSSRLFMYWLRLCNCADSSLQ